MYWIRAMTPAPAPPPAVTSAVARVRFASAVASNGLMRSSSSLTALSRAAFASTIAFVSSLHRAVSSSISSSWRASR